MKPALFILIILLMAMSYLAGRTEGQVKGYNRGEDALMRQLETELRVSIETGRNFVFLGTKIYPRKDLGGNARYE